MGGGVPRQGHAAREARAGAQPELPALISQTILFLMHTNENKHPLKQNQKKDRELEEQGYVAVWGRRCRGSREMETFLFLTRRQLASPS